MTQKSATVDSTITAGLSLVLPQNTPDDVEQSHRFGWFEIGRIALVALAAATTWSGRVPKFHGLDLLAVPVTLISGYWVFAKAFFNLVDRRMTMELSMTIALAAALAIGESFTALIILLFVLVAEVLEELTVDRGRRAIQTLLDLLPKRAIVRRGNLAEERAVEDLTPGDIVMIRPGAEIPVDGVVVHGRSFVDQSGITGESKAAEKTVGATVYAGTINGSGALEVNAVQLGRNTVFGKIVEAVERAEKSRAPVQKVADRLAGYLVYFALSAALITFLVTRDARATIAVIIVAGACGIAAGTPLAILGAISRSARHGAIVKGGLYLEFLGEVNTVFLDKTGTLTFGDPKVVEVLAMPGVPERQVIEAAAIAERASEHPLGKAILKKAAQLQLLPVEPDRFEYLPGKGIICGSSLGTVLVGSRALLMEKGVLPGELSKQAEDSSTVLVARNGRFLGLIRTEDRLRPEAIKAVEALQEMGIRVELLTGDSAAVAISVGERLGVDEIGAELLPHQKLERVEAQMAAGRRIAMVGDGINDAPALARANVGVAMGSGTDTARHSADVLLLGNNLLDFVETVKTARQCRRVIFTNFAGTLVVDAVGVWLAAFGILSPLLAAFIHVASEMIFILNSARLVPALSGRFRRHRTEAA
jgi:heavy metal translocating P-type ATPase